MRYALLSLGYARKNLPIYFIGTFFERDASRRAKELESTLSWSSHCMYACGFRIYFTPLPGFFSPFPHGTGSLSVDHEYLALEDGPPIFRQDFTCPALLVVAPSPTHAPSGTGLSPTAAGLSRPFP